MHRCSPSTQNPRLDTHEVSTMEFFLPQIDQVFLSPGKIFASMSHQSHPGCIDGPILDLLNVSVKRSFSDWPSTSSPVPVLTPSARSWAGSTWPGPRTSPAKPALVRLFILFKVLMSCSCPGPNSLVLALLYLERLRRRNPDYLTTVSSADLFLVSLMVASKFLHDDGEEDEVFNDEWASSAGIDTKELNKLEVKFLAAMDWRIFVDNAEFQSTLCRLEADIALREVSARDGDATYSDLMVLGSGEQAAHLLSLLAQAAIKVTAVCLTTYAAGLLTLLGTAAALSRTPLGPAQVSDSVRTLASAFHGLDDQEVVVHQVAEDNATRDEVRALSHADLVTASLLVTTLTSAPLTGDALNDEEEKEEQDRQQHLNRTRALWLSEHSNPPHGQAPDRSPWVDLPSTPGTYSMPVYRDRPETVTNHGPALPPLLSEAWRGAEAWREDRAALHHLGLQAPQADLHHRGRCPVLRWGSTTLKWGSVGACLPLLLTKA